MKTINIIYISIVLSLSSFSFAYAGEVIGNIDTGNYIISAPISNIKSGTYNSRQFVQLSSIGATSIYYTIDGSIPKCDIGKKYSEAIDVNRALSIKAISCYEGGLFSKVSQFDYRIERNSVSGGSYIQNFVVSAPSGEVLGESTSSISCTDYLNKPIVYGLKNNISDVKKLQRFLNKEMGSSIPETGFYGKITRSFVILFQEKYRDEILGKGYKGKGTGNIYKMTLKKINNLECGIK